MNPTAIFSKTGKGVQEASGKTSNLSRADRAVLKEIDGKTRLSEIALKFEKISADKFDALITQFDKDGYIREVSSGATAPQTPPPRPVPPPKAAPPPAPAGDEDEMDFTQAIKLPPKGAAAAPAAPKAPPMDLAAASRAEAERKAKEQEAFDYKARQEAEAKAKAEADQKARAAAAEARTRAEAEAKARAEAEAKSRAEAEARTRAEADAKVKAAREAAVRLATEAKAKAEAESKAKAKMEAELTGKLEEERRAREDAERRAREAADQARREMEEKSKREADELRQRLEAEMKAKLEEERKAREAEDRKRREEEDRKRAEEDRKRREEDERRRKEEEERRAKEEAARKAREEEDRKRREEEDRKRREEEDRKRAEEDRKRREEDERRRKEEEERRAKEEAARKAREAEDRKRREDDERRRKEEDERRAKDEADRRAREDADRRAKEEAERKAKEEAEAKARAAQAASASSASIPSIPVPPPPAPPAASGGGIADSLLADLDSFGQREEEEQREKEEAERKAKAEAARKAKEEAERKAKEEADRKRREEEESRRKEEAERKAQEEAERAAREEEERKKEEEAERKRKAKEAQAAKEAERKAAQRPAAAKSAAKDDDIGVSDDDLDMDDIKKDEKALSARARQAAKEREQAAVAAAAAPRPKKWGKPVAIALFVILLGGVGVLQFMPVSTAEYEKAASEAIGVPVKIGSARLSVLTGVEARFEAVSIGDAVKIRTVRGYPEIGSLFGGKKAFTRVELDGVSLSQSQIADAVLGKVSGANFRIARVVAKQLKMEGPLTLPALDLDAVVAGDGSFQSVSLRSSDKLNVQLSPKGDDIGFEITSGSMNVPFAPALNLSDFTMKGTANRAGVTSSEFDGRAFDGVISGTAKIRWGSNWTVDGEVRARAIKVAVIAPALVSEGRAEGQGKYVMSGTNPATLFEGARIQGEFKIEKGVLGSFDLTRALQTGGTQSTGRTIFSELTGQALYDKGTVRITNASITAGAMNAGASLDVDANGGLAGRVVADVKTPTQTLRATLNISGKLQDPVIRK